ncbi:MAG: hypothetical protein C6I01_02545 [Epsilonproteobacteria bacterium]|jgi:uncharacterized membrane protein required for colicin V production|nr:hypothetical protein [Campylobacterota bacterium]NPA88893.1 CvpA family protein [Campylobacterota bacterium]
MTTLDWWLVGLAIFFWLRGYSTGLRREIISLIGIFLGFWLAGEFYYVFTDWFMELMDLDKQGATIVGYVFTLLLMWFLVALFGIVFFGDLSNRAGKWERIGGAILSLFKYVAVFGAVIYLFSQNPYLKKRWLGEIDKSKFHSLFYNVGDMVLSPEIKDQFRKLPHEPEKKPKSDIRSRVEKVFGDKNGSLLETPQSTPENNGTPNSPNGE